MTEQSRLHQDTFHMPVYQGIFFEEKTQSALQVAFEKLTSSQNYSGVRFLQFNFHLVGASGERCVAEKDVNIHPDPAIRGVTPDAQEGTALRDIICAWSLDRLAVESIPDHPFPWFEQSRADRMADRYLSLYWRPEFCVLAQEHIPTFLMGDELDPLGKYQDRIHRTALASLILPDAKSNHAKLQVQSGFTQAVEHLDWLWEYIIEDEDDISLVLDDHAHPIPLSG